MFVCVAMADEARFSNVGDDVQANTRDLSGQATADAPGVASRDTVGASHIRSQGS